MRALLQVQAEARDRCASGKTATKYPARDLPLNLDFDENGLALTKFEFRPSDPRHAKISSSSDCRPPPIAPWPAAMRTAPRPSRPGPRPRSAWASCGSWPGPSCTRSFARLKPFLDAVSDSVRGVPPDRPAFQAVFTSSAHGKSGSPAPDQCPAQNPREENVITKEKKAKVPPSNSPKARGAFPGQIHAGGNGKGTHGAARRRCPTRLATIPACRPCCASRGRAVRRHRFTAAARLRISEAKARDGR